MVDRTDPARTGVKAGRLVGLLTAGLAVATLVATQSSFYAAMGPLVEALGVGGDRATTLLFWSNVATAAVARYGICYVAGSLIGVVYEWLDRPGVPALVVLAGVVGAGDAVLAYLDTFDPLVAGAYVLAWLCYVPAFVALFDDGEAREGPRRLRDAFDE